MSSLPMRERRYRPPHPLDLFLEVFGRERGLGGRATIGVMALANGVCFETWVTVEVE